MTKDYYKISNCCKWIHSSFITITNIYTWRIVVYMQASESTGDIYTVCPQSPVRVLKHCGMQTNCSADSIDNTVSNSSSIVVCTSVDRDTCLACCYLATTMSTYSITPAHQPSWHNTLWDKISFISQPYWIVLGTQNECVARGLPDASGRRLALQSCHVKILLCSQAPLMSGDIWHYQHPIRGFLNWSTFIQKQSIHEVALSGLASIQVCIVFYDDQKLNFWCNEKIWRSWKWPLVSLDSAKTPRTQFLDHSFSFDHNSADTYNVPWKIHKLNLLGSICL